jgi:putative membrane protein
MKLLTTAATMTVLVAALAACTSNDDRMMYPPPMAAPQDAPMPALSAADQDYVMMTASSNMLEIQKSQLALQRSGDEMIRRLAQMMIQDHTRLTNDAAPVLRQLGMDPAAMEMVPRHQQMLQQLRTAPAESFDRMYHDIQMMAHEEALALQRNYAANGADPQLRTIAAQAAPVIEMHLNHLRQHGSHLMGQSRPGERG